MRRTLKEQIMEKCKYYNGTINKACDAGVLYESVRLAEAKGFEAYPCFGQGNQCAHRAMPTEAEVDAKIAEINKRTANIIQARTAIVERCGGPWKKGQAGSSGTVACPVCKSGSLGFTRSGYNGHIHARCSTKDCVAWME